jgi:MazG family protein
MKQLRDPVKGCAWDLEQDHSSLVRYLEEESQELIEAIKSKDSDNIKEELGDVLLQVIFHSQIAHENKEFDFFDVVKNLKQKLIRRHPYVFDKSKKHTKEEQKAMWEKIKRAEKGG